MGAVRDLGERAKRFVSDECGSTAIEYGLMAALIAVACIAAFTAFGNGLQNLFGANSSGAGGVIEEATATVNS